MLGQEPQWPPYHPEGVERPGPVTSYSHLLPNLYLSVSSSPLVFCSLFKASFLAVSSVWSPGGPTASRTNKQTTGGSRGSGKEGDGDASHRALSCPTGPGHLLPHPIPASRTQRSATQHTADNDSHPLPVPSQGLCPQKGSFPQSSPEQAHIPLPTYACESTEARNETLRQREVLVVSFQGFQGPQSSFHLSI